MTFILCGDVPTFSQLHKFRFHRAIPKYDAVVSLNVRDLNGLYFPRNYHLIVQSGLLLHQVKEPNFFLANLHRIKELAYEDLSDFRIFDWLYGGRKTHQYKDKEGKDFGRGAIVVRFLSKPILGYKIRKTLEQEDGLNATPKFMRLSTIEKLFELMERNVKVSVRNRDPGALEDIDSYEDWAFTARLFQLSDPRRVYPSFSDVESFSRDVMPDLKQEVRLWKESAEFMNTWMERFGLVKPVNGEYEHPYYSDGSSFLKYHPYRDDGKIDIGFARDSVEEMVRKNFRYHKRFLRRAKWKERIRRGY